MATDDAASSDRILTKANFVRVYKSLTVVAVEQAANESGGKSTLLEKGASAMDQQLAVLTTTGYIVARP